MAHTTLINGTSYEITGGNTLVDGTKYSISNGKTLVGGTIYDISFVEKVSINLTADIATGFAGDVGSVWTIGLKIYDQNGLLLDDIFAKHSDLSNVTYSVESSYENVILTDGIVTREYSCPVGGSIHIDAYDSGSYKAIVSLYINGTFIERSDGAGDWDIVVTGATSIITNDPNLGVNVTMEGY